MAHRHFFTSEVRGDLAFVRGESADHLRRVLRTKPGDLFELSDNGATYLAQVSGFRSGEVIFKILQRLPDRLPPVHVELFVALIKFDRLEDLLEKATELGVSRIQVFQAQRSQGGLERAAQKRFARWQKILKEASQQSRRTNLPELLPVGSFEEVVAKDFDLRLFLDEEEKSRGLLGVLPPVELRARDQRIGLLVGPEGGWTDQERELAVRAGWQPVSLGPLILRTETAAMAALAVITAAWSEKATVE